MSSPTGGSVSGQATGQPITASTFTDLNRLMQNIERDVQSAPQYTAKTAVLDNLHQLQQKIQSVQFGWQQGQGMTPGQNPTSRSGT